MLIGRVMLDNFRLFSSYTLKSENYKEYKWTWCGRYSVPAALYTAYYLNDSKPLNGELIGYSTSITSDHIPVDDIRMEGLPLLLIATGLDMQQLVTGKFVNPI